jgi:hypothetical protein
LFLWNWGLNSGSGICSAGILNPFCFCYFSNRVLLFSLASLDFHPPNYAFHIAGWQVCSTVPSSY